MQPLNGKTQLTTDHPTPCQWHPRIAVDPDAPSHGTPVLRIPLAMCLAINLATHCRRPMPLRPANGQAVPPRLFQPPLYVLPCPRHSALAPVHHPVPRLTLALHRRCPCHPCRPHTTVVGRPRATTAGHPRTSVIGHPRATAQSFIYIANLSLKFIDKHYHQCVSLIFDDNLPPFCHRNIVIICHIILSLKYFGDNLSSFYHRI